MYEFNNCPFCNADENTGGIAVQRKNDMNTIRGSVAVTCNRCGSWGPSYPYDDNDRSLQYVDAVKRAVAAWNSFGKSTRAPSPKMISYMRFIEKYSRVTPPFNASWDFDSCYMYISKHKDIAHKNYNEIGHHTPYSNSTGRRSYGCFSEHAIGDEDSGVTCFDAGIFPFGNS